MLSSALSRLLAAGMLLGLLSGCVSLPHSEQQSSRNAGHDSRGDLSNLEIRGVNLLQTSNVALGSPLLASSLVRLRETGATTVALVPFMQMSGPMADEVSRSDAVTDEQLIAGIRRARIAGFRVVLKPQILVVNSWAGEVRQQNEIAWKRWFESYSAELLHYAEIAAKENVETLVVGTELKQTGKRREWRRLITDLRRVFPGKLTYAAHNPDGVADYDFWDQLDMVGVTMYPPLGTEVSREEMKLNIVAALDALEKQQQRIGKSVLIAEVGVASMYGGQATPWQVPAHGVSSDVEMQAMVLDEWLSEVGRRSWIKGLLIWNWFSDPYAGGRADTDFTVQNKPAEAVIKCHWARICGTAN